MTRRGIVIGVALALIAALGGAAAQDTVSSLTRPYSREEVDAKIPQPASAIPPMEAVGGTIGTAGTYRPADATNPRITRATLVSTAAGGTFSGTWSMALPTAPVIVLTPIAAAASIDCQLTAAPTTTTFQGRCWTAQSTVLNLGIITAGLTLNPVANSAAGIQVRVLAIPPTQ